MKIGLYFGSFNPIHIGHLIIANHVLNETELEKIWLIVSPQNPFKINEVLLDENKRLQLAQAATSGDIRIIPCDFEFRLPKPSYSIHTLNYIKENFPKDEFSFIMGSDSFQNFDQWKDYESILQANEILVYLRPGFDVKTTLSTRVQILKAPLLEISSTEIRKMIEQGKSIRYLVPENVRAEIEKNGYYKK